MNWSTAQVAEAYRRQGLPNPVQSACAEGPVRSKYGAKRTVRDGIEFASRAEADVYVVLKIAQEAGHIADLFLQPRYLLQAGFRDEQGKRHRPIYYQADFKFIRCMPDHCPDQLVVVEVKGYETAVWRMKEKLFRAKYGSTISLEIWGKAGQVR